MPQREYEVRRPMRDLEPSARRNLVAKSLLRSLGVATALVVVYYLLPLDHLSDATSIIGLVIGLVGVVLLLAVQTRAILSADFPGMKAVEALAFLVPLLLLLFASAYYLLDRASPASFTERLSRTDALYFTVTTFSTVGYGDITARTDGTRIAVMFQMLFDLVVLGVGVKVIFGAAEAGLQRQSGSGSHSTAGDGDPGTTGRE